MLPDVEPVELMFARACCPVCHRRGRDVTVGFAVEAHGFFALARHPRKNKRGWKSLDGLFMGYWQVAAGASYLLAAEPLGVRLRPPIWPGSSTRMPEELTRTPGPVTSCRYRHRLRVPTIDEIDRMLARIRGDVLFLPAARV